MGAVTDITSVSRRVCPHPRTDDQVNQEMSADMESTRSDGGGPVVGTLSGLRVVDLSANMSGPYATMLLADQGADVVKIEPPDGDILRRVGTGRGGVSAYFANLNRSKRSVVVDLRKPESTVVIDRLLDGADVLVQNFRPGVAERLGLGVERVMGRHPQLVYVSISGFGQTGPLATMPAYDHIVQAFSGMAALQAPKNGDPALVRHGIVDKTTGMMAAEAALAAIIARSRTGLGCHVEISMLDVAVSLMWPDGMMNHTCLDEGIEKVPTIAASFRLTPTSDGWVALVTVTGQQWRGMLTAFNLHHRINDPEYSTSAGRLRNGGVVMREVGAVVATMQTQDVVTVLRENDVPCMPVLLLDDLAGRLDEVCPGMIERTQHPVLGTVQQPRPPAAFGGLHGQPVASPVLGADTDGVLSQAGLDDDAIAALRAANVVG